MFTINKKSAHIESAIASTVKAYNSLKALYEATGDTAYKAQAVKMVEAIRELREKAGEL